MSLVGCITTYSLAVPYDIPCITTYSLYRTHSPFQKGSACKSQELMPHVWICMIQLPNKHNSAINEIIENLLLQMYVYIAN